ncbi:MAG: PD-(D/E)XK nuclease family protein, partial [Candidatus Omnitrophica bacterium]|nr:PD-(D/E)XK nuclease family protein [Candidatus Omnitrophota bacterium]
PKLDIRSSLVPREVMISLKLDRLELEEEIQRYQFMRVISSAKNVHLVYQERPDKERSRFIEELVWEEEKKRNARMDFPVERAAFAVQINPQLRSVPKTPALLDFLGSFRFSATSINTYLKNPYEFYASYCLGLKENEDLLDEPDGRQIGNFIHELLKEAFTPLLKKPFVMDEEASQRLNKLFEKKFEAEFTRSMRSDAFLLKAVIAHRLKVFMDKEQDRAPLVSQILHIEQAFESAIPLSGRAVRCYSVVDRVDLLKDGTVCLIDYKTGGNDRLPKKDFDASGGLSRELIFKDVSSFQMPLYYYFLSMAYPQARIQTQLYHLREARLEAFPKAPVAAHEEFLKPYLKALDFLITEIMDPQKPFIDDDLAI